MARSRSLRSKQARSQRPDRFREGYLVNVNLRSDVPARGNRAHIYGCDIYIYVCVCVHLSDVPSIQRANVASVIYAPFEKRDLSDIACSFASPSSIFKFLADSDPESVCHKCGNMRDRCAPAKYVIS